MELAEAYQSALDYIGKNIPDDYPLETFSYSNLREIEDFPARWRDRYLRRWSSPPSAVMVVGTATHHALEQHYHGKDALQEGLDFINNYEDFPEPSKKAASLVQIERMVNAYVGAYPERDCVGAEIATGVDLGRGVQMQSIADLVIEGDDGLVLRDYKTTGRNFTPDPLQIAVTAMTLASRGIVVSRGEFVRLRRDLKRDILKVYPFEIDRDFLRDACKVVIDRLDRVSAYVRLDVWPDPPMPEKFYGQQYPTHRPTPQPA